MRAQQAQIQQLNAQSDISNRAATTYIRSPSPIRIQPFSNAALVQLAEKLKNEEHFYTTLPVSICTYIKHYTNATKIYLLKKNNC